MTREIHNENQIQYVKSFNDLVSTSFIGEVNSACWSRNIKGDFSEIVKKVELKGNMAVLTKDELLALNLTRQGELARDTLIKDFKVLKEHGASPILNIIKNYERDDAFPIFPTDVYSFHVDRSPIHVDTFLCTYYGNTSEILPNSQAIQKVLVPEIRKELQELYNGPKDGFESFLSEYFFDLHYQANPNANLVKMEIGHLWKLAVDHPNMKSLPCLHRAPKEKQGQSRLLMIC